MTGVSGGTFAINMVAVGADGAVYAGNLSTATTSPFKVYRWTDGNAGGPAPTLAVDLQTALTRTGDAFAVIGSGADTRIAASGSGHNRIAIFDTTDGTTFTLTSDAAITGLPTGGARLGMAWVDSDTIIGKQTGQAIHTVDLPNTLTNSIVNAAGEAPLAFYAPLNLLATIDINSNAVRLYDASNKADIAGGFQDIANLTTSFNTNSNATGDLAFGMHNGVLRLYAMNTNNGIQAFEVIPEPSTVAAILGFSVLGLALVVRRRRRA
jgi:hypothetical protein